MEKIKKITISVEHIKDISNIFFFLFSLVWWISHLEMYTGEGILLSIEKTFFDPYTWVCLTLEWPVKALAIIFLVKEEVDRVWIDTFPFYGLIRSLIRKSTMLYRTFSKEKNLTSLE